MTAFRRGQGRRKGFGLVLALATLAVTAILAAAAASVVKVLLRDSLYQQRQLQAQFIAESGAEAALARLARDGTWRAGLKGERFAGGYYDVVLGPGAIPTVTATGHSAPLLAFGRARRTVRFAAQVLPIPSMPHAVRANDFLHIVAGASRVDGYDSTKALEPSVFGERGDALAAKNLVFQGAGTVVFGDASYGTGGEPAPGFVSGSVKRASGPLALVEDGASFRTQNDNAVGIEPASVFDASLGRLRVPWSSTATLRSGVYHLKELRVDGTLRAEVTDGPVLIFLDGPLTLAGAVDNASRVPANVVIYGQSGACVWTLVGTRPFHGLLHAPQCDLILRQTVYGAVAGKTVSLLKGAVHYDVNVGRPKAHAVRMAPRTWQGDVKTF